VRKKQKKQKNRAISLACGGGGGGGFDDGLILGLIHQQRYINYFLNIKINNLIGAY
jgi:hypothetical protein